jgi:hypothetical protein
MARLARVAAAIHLAAVAADHQRETAQLTAEVLP